MQPELLLFFAGYKIEESDTDYNFEAKTKLDYINVPIMAKYYIIDGLSAELGHKEF